MVELLRESLTMAPNNIVTVTVSTFFTIVLAMVAVAGCLVVHNR